MKKIHKILIGVIAIFLVGAIVVGVFFDDIFRDTAWFIEKSLTADVKLTISDDKNGETLDGFGTSACWWSQLAGDSEYAEETAKQYLIYRDELRLLEISVWLENLETLKTNAIKLDTDLSLAREELKKANADLEALYAASEQFSARIHENDIAQEEKRTQLSELDAQVKEQESAVAVLQTGIA